MPLHILLILVIGGIGGIAVALHLLGLSQTPELDEASAKVGWSRHFPEDHVISTAPNAEGSAALIHTDQGLGLVWRLGADTVARRLTEAQAEAHARGLLIRFPDFASPKIALDLNADEQRIWANRIKEQS